MSDVLMSSMQKTTVDFIRKLETLESTVTDLKLINASESPLQIRTIINYKNYMQNQSGAEIIDGDF